MSIIPYTHKIRERETHVIDYNSLKKKTRKIMEFIEAYKCLPSVANLERPQTVTTAVLVRGENLKIQKSACFRRIREVRLPVQCRTARIPAGPLHR